LRKKTYEFSKFRKPLKTEKGKELNIALFSLHFFLLLKKTWPNVFNRVKKFCFINKNKINNYQSSNVAVWRSKIWLKHNWICGCGCWATQSAKAEVGHIRALDELDVVLHLLFGPFSLIKASSHITQLRSQLVRVLFCIAKKTRMRNKKMRFRCFENN